MHAEPELFHAGLQYLAVFTIAGKAQARLRPALNQVGKTLQQHQNAFFGGQAAHKQNGLPGFTRPVPGIGGGLNTAVHHPQLVPVCRVRKQHHLAFAKITDADDKISVGHFGTQRPIDRVKKNVRAMNGHAETNACKPGRQHGNRGTGVAQVVVQMVHLFAGQVMRQTACLQKIRHLVGQTLQARLACFKSKAKGFKVPQGRIDQPAPIGAHQHRQPKGQQIGGLLALLHHGGDVAVLLPGRPDRIGQHGPAQSPQALHLALYEGVGSAGVAAGDVGQYIGLDCRFRA